MNRFQAAGASGKEAESEETPSQRTVREATGESETRVIDRALEWHDGETDAAIEFLIEQGRNAIVEELETERVVALSRGEPGGEATGAEATKKESVRGKDRVKTNKAMKHQAAMNKKELKKLKKEEKARKRGASTTTDESGASAADAVAQRLGALRI